MRNVLCLAGFLLLLFGCTSSVETDSKIKLITLDPGHFHAALIQKSMYPEIDANVSVYGPDTSDIEFHLNRIEQYNSRESDPTTWNTKVFKGSNFIEQWKKEGKGNVVMLSGNNQKKTDYILTAIEEGYHVYADKPMAINVENYTTLKRAFALADEKQLLIYDIMTERFEITTLLQKELSQIPSVFGNLIQGSVEEPAITKESVHHYYKNVSGAPLIRPTWFFDTQQQGEGIADVSVHLVDLTFWECFPNTSIYTSDVEVIQAERWPTLLSTAKFKKVTGGAEIPDYLQPSLANDTLSIYANGAISFTVKGHHAKVSVLWNYEAPNGGSDTHYSIMRGTNAHLVIVQDEEHKYTPTLYILPQKEIDESILQQAITSLKVTYPGIELTSTSNGWRVDIPNKLREGHEAHFAAVTKNFISYYQNQSIPQWERDNMITKYYLTTQALSQAKNR